MRILCINNTNCNRFAFAQNQRHNLHKKTKEQTGLNAYVNYYKEGSPCRRNLYSKSEICSLRLSDGNFKISKNFDNNNLLMLEKNGEVILACPADKFSEGQYLYKKGEREIVLNQDEQGRYSFYGTKEDALKLALALKTLAQVSQKNELVRTFGKNKNVNEGIKLAVEHLELC